MPTETRSSNTEQMVSVPRDEVERLVKLLKYQAHPSPSPHAEFWEGLLDAPAAQHKGDPDRALKDALFACLAAGGDDREYGGVATAGDRQGWVRFTTVAAGAQYQGEPAAAIPDGYCLMPRRLTAENGAKALLLGEFKLEVIRECPECIDLEEPAEGCEICDGEGEYAQRHTIPWAQIKFIYSEAVKGLALQPSRIL
ncbi:hypothetical protein [Pseudomonas palmensis]|uniref:hypothetical protein n=1 Tax=Pseudomonas palmensis TaxID=2815362 RepID=UPI0039EC0E13